MKYIKKVSVSDLVSNTGTIIDSMNSGDDQTVNAPSIHAVKEYVGNYSTTEQIIGTYFGKPLYRKAVDLTNITINQGRNQFPHNIANLELCIRADLKATQQGYMFPYFWNSNGDYTAINEVGGSNIYIYSSANWETSDNYRVILEYTKTTD